MIKFFRHIRQRLISENRFSKYLLYAIGEIVLVVIGILIALQINTWNEGRKNNNTAQHYLNTLKAEFESVLTSFVGASKFAGQRFSALEEKIDQILSRINQELNKPDR